jgi:hypothetical protein
MKYGMQPQDEEFMERMLKGGTTANAVNYTAIRDGGFYVYRGKLDERKALKVIFSKPHKRWEVFDPEDEDPNVPVCTNARLTPCVHYCISIL